MQLAWRFGGSDPFRLYHGLDMFYRPFGSEKQVFPAEGGRRLRNFVYACGVASAQQS